MEMEPNHSDDMEGFADESSEQLNSPYTSYQNGLNGEPEIVPRVGDQYQADIPEDGYLKVISCYVSNPHLHNPVTFGLPIPLMWTRSEKFRGFREAESEKDRPVTATSGSNTPSSNVSIEKDETAVSSKHRSIVLALPCQRIAKFKYECLDKSLYPFPGTLGESWEEAERERFLLGLYCLGKNLVLVQRFVESKKMGDILSYYYGKFYRSGEYRRWADGRKLRSRRSSVQGQKLFTGWRQQELLSRISSHVSEECKSLLLKVSKALREEKMDVEEYVFTLKKSVGINMLTEAIGIGKGKTDLTSYASEPPKSNYATSGNSEVPKDIDWSSLSLTDIVRYLTGGFRLSKNRSSHLFWEAVWPRLLERGWHSEQPKGRPNNSLVYLIPEANKFSRRRMTKGNHYFDSLTDVLTKVASDPTLLELESDVITEKGIKEEVIKNVPIINLEKFDDSSPYSKKQRYLQPRKTIKSQQVLKFTIVDTSKAHGVGGCTLIELRHMPDESSGGSIAISPCYLTDSEDNLSDESENEVEAKSMASRVCGGSLSSGKSSSVISSVDNVTSRSTVSLNKRQHEKLKGRPRKPKLLPVCAKRSSLAACSFSESDCFVETQPKKKKTTNRETQKRPNPSEAHENVVMRDENIDQSLKPSSTSSFVEGNSCGIKQERSSIQGEMSPKGPEIREDFDLNVSQISTEHEATGTVMTDTVQNSESSCAEQSSVQMDVEMQYKPHEILKVEVATDLHSGLRQSTRSRPLTTKALEAFAFGFLGNSKKKRKVSEDSRSRSRPKSTKRIHSNTIVTSDFRNGTVNDSSNTDENE